MNLQGENFTKVLQENDPFEKFHGKTFGSHNMTLLYPNPCYNVLCYKGTTLYLHYIRAVLVLVFADIQ